MLLTFQCIEKKCMIWLVKGFPSELSKSIYLNVSEDHLWMTQGKYLINETQLLDYARALMCVLECLFVQDFAVRLHVG